VQKRDLLAAEPALVCTAMELIAPAATLSRRRGSTS
jgi:hypothetical protein